MSNGLLNASGLTTPKVITEEIILKGKPISDALANESNIKIIAPHALGDFYFSITPHIPDGVLPLNGLEVSRTTYSDLYNYVLTIHNELVASGKKFIVSEEEWQNISIENNGYVPYYSYGTGDTLFRLPRMSGYLKATGEVDEAGNYVAEGLPNITGCIGHGHSPSSTGRQGSFNSDLADGAFYQDTNVVTGGQYYPNWNGTLRPVNLDASRSSLIYGNSEHVTPETNTLFVGVWALVAFTQVGTANLNEIKEILKSSESYLMNNVPLMSSRWDRDGLGNLGWVKADGSWLDGKTYTSAYNYCVEHIQSGDSKFIVGQVSTITQENYDKFIVDTLNKRFRLPLSNSQRTLVKEWKDGYNYYRIYSDGFCEQGGAFGTSTGDWATVVVNFFVPFLDTNYHIFAQGNWSSAPSTSCKFTTKTTSSATITYANNLYTIQPSIWVASGYVSVPILSDYNCNTYLYFKLAHEFYAPSQADLQEKVDMIDSLVTKVDIDLPTLSSRWDSPFAENIGWVKSEGNWLNGNTYRDAYDMMVSRIGVNDKFVAATVGTELTDDNADKFLIDTAAVRFRLPLVSGERTLVKEWKNGYNYYRIYSDGWCEMCGRYDKGSFSRVFSSTITLPYTMKNANYLVTLTASGMDGDKWGSFGLNAENLTTTQFDIFHYSYSDADGVRYVYWKVQGFANVPTVSDYNCNTYLYFKLADQVPSTVVDTQVVVDDLKSECDAFKQECQSTLERALEWCIPDWSAAIAITTGKFTAPCAGAVISRGFTNTGGMTQPVGNLTYYAYGNAAAGSTFYIPIASGEVITIVKWTGYDAYYFVPFKGAN